MLRWRRRSTVARRWAQNRLEDLILEASLDAKRAGDDELACALYDTSRALRRTIPRKLWRGLAAYDESGLRAIVAAMLERWSAP